MSDYLLPERNAFGDSTRYVLNVSGGRTSGFMLRQILDAYGGSLPPHVIAVFANTGKERVETLEFVDRMSREWGVEIVWLEYRHRADASGGIRDLKHVHEIVNYETASREGEPFEAMIRAKGVLPHVVARICTDQLKINVIQWYVTRELGWAKNRWANVLGIRADEPQRIRAALMEECRVVYPLVLADVTVADVNRYWRHAPFDLGISTHQGNCDLCFLKGKGKLLSLIAEEPERIDWWIAQEDYRTAIDRTDREALWFWREDYLVTLEPEPPKWDNNQFRPRESFRELQVEAMSQQRFVFDDEPGISCFCGD